MICIMFGGYIGNQKYLEPDKIAMANQKLRIRKAFKIYFGTTNPLMMSCVKGGDDDLTNWQPEDDIIEVKENKETREIEEKRNNGL